MKKFIRESSSRRESIIMKIKKRGKWITQGIVSVDYKLPEYMANRERPSVKERLLKKVKKVWGIDFTGANELTVNL